MSIRSLTRLAGAALAAASLFVATDAQAASSLVTSLELGSTAPGVEQDVQVRVSMTNTGTRKAYVLKWQTPFFGLEDNLFEVTRDGEPAVYVGKQFKRPAPRVEDFLVFEPGQTRTADVELSASYDMSRPGEYVIRYRIDLQEALQPAKLGASYPAGEEVASNAVAFWRDGNEPLADLLPSLDKGLSTGTGDAGGDLAYYLTPSFVSCSSSRQSSITSALSSAQTYASNSLSYLNAGTRGARYTSWFGTYSSGRYSTVRSHFSSISSTIQNQRITFNCSCTQNYYAYVYPNSPYTIYLCNAFWSAPTTGTDSKAGTIIHELSHFNVVAGTDDWAYGQTACRSLATSNANRATDNADSHEYFAENTPFQN
jgi:peptidyl-Lys metalloendopeptidase